MTKKNKTRRNGLVIVGSLLTLLGSFTFVMLLAVLTGSLGYLSSMGVTFFGAVGVSKALGYDLGLSYGLIITLAVLCGVLRGLLKYVEQYMNHFIAFKLLAIIRDKVFKALRRLCPAKLESKKKGSIIALLTGDIETLEVFYAHTVSPIFIAAVVSTVVFLLTGFLSSWILAFIELGGFIVVGIIDPLISSHFLKNSGVRYRKEFADFNSYFLDSIKGVREIVMNGEEKKRTEEVNELSEAMLKETKNMKHHSSISSSITELLVFLFDIAALVTGMVLVISKSLSLGALVIGITLILNSFGPVRALSNLPSNLTNTFASGDRLLDLLQEKPVVSEIKNGKDFSYQDLEVKDVSFKYEDSEKETLKDVNLQTKKGEVIGILGPSGSGKSTLLKLLLRFYPHGKGELNYNGITIDEINTSSLLDNVTMVSQSTYLFDMTIEENLRIAKQDATLEEIREACRKASIDDFIMSLPDGYKSRVGTLGDRLSAGEKQRIGLARAFLSDAELILLDEPTSNVDAINEGIILESLAKEKDNHSIILVSHRESTMSLCDRVYKMDKGVLSEEKAG